jgi:hypothetical protein
MEIIYQRNVDLAQVASLHELTTQRDLPEPRDTGLWHVTSLLKASRSIVKGEPAYSDGPPSEPGIASLGRIWETAMDSYMRSFAKELDGVFMPNVTYVEEDIGASLDGVLLLPAYIAVYECKLRFSLSRDIPLDQLRQIRAYCHFAGSQVVCFVSCHVSTTPPLAQATLRMIRLTQQSIEETWQGIVNTKNYLISQGIDPGNNNN